MKRRVGDVLDLVQLAGREHRKPRQLSGGQQQRVAVARALVNHPRVLLIDEPLGALDLKLRKEMQIELKRIQQEVGITFIHVTHDQEEAMTMADTIAVMNKGHIERMGAPSRSMRPRTRSLPVSSGVQSHGGSLDGPPGELPPWWITIHAIRPAAHIGKLRPVWGQAGEDQLMPAATRRLRPPVCRPRSPMTASSA